MTQSEAQRIMLEIATAVADGRASWRAAGISPKRLAADCRMALGSAYRRLDATEAYLRWLMTSQPLPTARLLAALAAESLRAVEAAGQVAAAEAARLPGG